MGTLYIIATPIGNLKDITLRAVEVLKSVDLVLAEDTRVAKKLLSHYDIRKPVWRADAQSERKIARGVLIELKNGKDIAFLSDAGTPNISDPSSFLVDYLYTHSSDANIVSVPGVSAIASFLSISGINADTFTFLGYPPHKKGRNTFFEELKNIKTTPIVFFESPHRLQKTFDDILKIFGKDMKIVVGKELTKIHEEIWRGTIDEAKKYFVGSKGKGEFIFLLYTRPLSNSRE